MLPLNVLVSHPGWAGALGPGSDSSADESEGGGFKSLITLQRAGVRGGSEVGGLVRCVGMEWTGIKLECGGELC